jgi:hypothetical protein
VWRLPTFLILHPSTSRYAFDVDKKTQAFINRRVFAYVDAGMYTTINIEVVRKTVFSVRGAGRCASRH